MSTTTPLPIGTEIRADVDTFGIHHDFVARIVGRNWFFDRVQSYTVRIGFGSDAVETVVPADYVEEVAS